MSKDKDIYLNGSGIRDPVAMRAIQNADQTVRFGQPKELEELIGVIKTVTRLAGYDIEGRITFRDRKSNKIYK